jgi:hypothetical protein
MTSSANTTPRINTGFSLDELGQRISNGVNAALNWLFSLSNTAATNRNSVIWLLFAMIFIILTINGRSTETWGTVLGHLLAAMLNPASLPEGMDATGAMFEFLGAVWNPAVARHLLALYAPFWLMHHLAAIYLADVFEKEVPIAEKFIIQAAFGREYNTIHIREGKIVEDDQSSPIVQIGGPGYVTVELDSAVLFETPDGIPVVIGPTLEKWHGSAIVHGFERIRQAADLRDVISGQTIGARSRDGIPVVAKDVQYSFSVYRGEKPEASLERPYPFDNPKAIESLVYKTGRTVTPGKPPSSGHDWEKPQPGKNAGPVGGELSGFISKKGLSEFLSTIGAPEDDALRARQQEVEQQPGQPPANPVAAAPARPTFTSRAGITALFTDDSFKKLAAGKGLQVNWIGVGTWDIPAEIIPANHMDAWKLSRENFTRGNEEALRTLRDEQKQQGYLRLVQGMPIGKFYQDLKQSDDDHLVQTLLTDYYERLVAAVEILERRSERPPTNLLAAIDALRGLLGHWMGE